MDRNYLKSDPIYDGLSVSLIKMDDYQRHMQAQEFLKAFKSLSSQVVPILKQNSNLLCIVADDPDLAAMLIAEFILQMNSSVSNEQVVEIMKERRPQTNPLRQIEDCLKKQNVTVQSKTSQIELTRRQHITNLFKQLKKDAREPCF